MAYLRSAWAAEWPALATTSREVSTSSAHAMKTRRKSIGASRSEHRTAKLKRGIEPRVLR